MGRLFVAARTSIQAVGRRMVMCGFFGTRAITVISQHRHDVEDGMIVSSHLDPSIIADVFPLRTSLGGAFVFALGGKAVAVSSGIFCLLDRRSEELGRATVAGGLEPAEALRLRRGGRGVLGDVERSADAEVGLVVEAGAAEVWATWLAA